MERGHRIRNGAALAGYFAGSFGAAWLGAWATGQGMESWYGTLAKPAWTPPDWMFPVVWTSLYSLMALSAWLVWLKRRSVPVKAALRVFWIQLWFNAFWSYWFFYCQRVDLAFFWIGILWMLILAMIFFFWRVRPLAALMNVPYVLWVSYAVALNLEIWRVNAQA